jgi:hypothetical protein
LSVVSEAMDDEMQQNLDDVRLDFCCFVVLFPSLGSNTRGGDRPNETVLNDRVDAGGGGRGATT